MPQTLTVQMILAFAVLALCIFAYGESSSPAWWWMVLIGAVLAVVVLADAWPERRRALGEPLSVKVTAFVVADLVLPVLVLLAGLAALVMGGEGWLDAAIVLAVALAFVSLL
ncbi:hypothetical protein [Hyphomicrobium sp.]|uniref:hypothetical protein n=1 Tax=Hyphomicrobium sp. TaxID=82 RepID=UPI0025BB2469|nr:hypothetical protein [Hyphomicrobium sp.]MCC7252969.1 hypothetical protein [Hyphomicrobium sp.]